MNLTGLLFFFFFFYGFHSFSLTFYGYIYININLQMAKYSSKMSINRKKKMFYLIPNSPRLHSPEFEIYRPGCCNLKISWYLLVFHDCGNPKEKIEKEWTPAYQSRVLCRENEKEKGRTHSTETWPFKIQSLFHSRVTQLWICCFSRSNNRIMCMSTSVLITAFKTY